MALPLNGKKNHFTRNDLIEYYGIEKLKLNSVLVNDILKRFNSEIPRWKKLIEMCFLSDQRKEEYLRVLEKRVQVLGL